jgi:hypothetical protein
LDSLGRRLFALNFLFSSRCLEQRQQFVICSLTALYTQSCHEAGKIFLTAVRGVRTDDAARSSPAAIAGLTSKRIGSTCRCRPADNDIGVSPPAGAESATRVRERKRRISSQIHVM